MGGSDRGAGIELSYTKPNSFIIKNCRFHPGKGYNKINLKGSVWYWMQQDAVPGFKKGTRRPRIFSIFTPPNLLMILAWPTISSNQSSMVALFSHHDSGLLWVIEWTAISWPWLQSNVKNVILDSYHEMFLFKKYYKVLFLIPSYPVCSPWHNSCTRVRHRKLHESDIRLDSLLSEEIIFPYRVSNSRRLLHRQRWSRPFEELQLDLIHLEVTFIHIKLFQILTKMFETNRKNIFNNISKFVLEY